MASPHIHCRPLSSSGKSRPAAAATNDDGQPDSAQDSTQDGTQDGQQEREPCGENLATVPFLHVADTLFMCLYPVRHTLQTDSETASNTRRLRQIR